MDEADDSDLDADNDRAAELDGLRIRQLAALRRSLYRGRSHAIVAMIVCLAAVIQASILFVQHCLRIGAGWRLMLYGGFIIAGAYGAIWFKRHAMAMHCEATKSWLDDPKVAPDFSTLGDGSQRWKNLEEL